MNIAEVMSKHDDVGEKGQIHQYQGGRHGITAAALGAAKLESSSPI